MHSANNTKSRIRFISMRENAVQISKKTQLNISKL